MQEYAKHIAEWMSFFGVSERVKETSVQMLKPKPGKCIEDSLQEVKVLLCKNTFRNINE